MALVVTSENFKEGEILPNAHVLSEAFGLGCQGGNQSPQLSWKNLPSGTESIAITCFDPDAPTDCGFWHWIAVNIPPTITSLPIGAGNPAGRGSQDGWLEVRTDFGFSGYAGPCAPEGSNVHRYIFTVHALRVPKLPVAGDTSGAIVSFYINANVIEKASIIGLFRR